MCFGYFVYKALLTGRLLQKSLLYGRYANLQFRPNALKMSPSRIVRSKESPRKKWSNYGILSDLIKTVYVAIFKKKMWCILGFATQRTNMDLYTIPYLRDYEKETTFVVQNSKTRFKKSYYFLTEICNIAILISSVAFCFNYIDLGLR